MLILSFLLISIFTILITASLTTTTTSTGECKPVTWQNEGAETRIATASDAATQPTKAKWGNLISTGNLVAGEVNCRYSSITMDVVDAHTCNQLATQYKITLEKFFKINPNLTQDCGNIKPDTEYCVAGFIEPLRAVDGFCGPKHGYATCLGSEQGQCCNSETWTCGESTEDCAPGICYEGACAGDKIYSTDGTCGYKHGSRLCAGKWGDCCNVYGMCGTGADFCGADVCHFGNCSLPIETVVDQSVPLWWSGNTTDGTVSTISSATSSSFTSTDFSSVSQTSSERSSSSTASKINYI